MDPQDQIGRRKGSSADKLSSHPRSSRETASHQEATKNNIYDIPPSSTKHSDAGNNSNKEAVAGTRGGMPPPAVAPLLIPSSIVRRNRRMSLQHPPKMKAALHLALDKGLASSASLHSPPTTPGTRDMAPTFQFQIHRRSQDEEKYFRSLVGADSNELEPVTARYAPTAPAPLGGHRPAQHQSSNQTPTLISTQEFINDNHQTKNSDKSKRATPSIFSSASYARHTAATEPIKAIAILPPQNDKPSVPTQSIPAESDNKVRRRGTRIARSLSSPYFHSWHFGNVDLSENIYISPFDTLKQRLSQKWAKQATLELTRTSRTLGPSSNSIHLHQITKSTREQSNLLTKALMFEGYRKDIQIEKGQSGKVIVAGTTQALILALLDQEFISFNEHFDAIIYTHSAWIKSTDLLKHLINIYNHGIHGFMSTPPHNPDILPPNSDKPDLLHTTIRNRIIEIIHSWIEASPSDFVEREAGQNKLDRTPNFSPPTTPTPNSSPLKILQHFLSQVLVSESGLECNQAEIVIGTLNLATKHLAEPRPPPSSSSASLRIPPVFKLRQLDPSKMVFLDFSPKFFAQQLTSFDFQKSRLLTSHFLSSVDPDIKLLSQDVEDVTEEVVRAREELIESTVSPLTSPLASPLESPKSPHLFAKRLEETVITVLPSDSPKDDTIRKAFSSDSLDSVSRARSKSSSSKIRVSLNQLKLSSSSTSSNQSLASPKTSPLPKPTPKVEENSTQKTSTSSSTTASLVNDLNLKEILARYSLFSGWVTTEIVTSPNVSARIVILGNFIETAFRCYSIRNFHSAYNIVSGIKRSAVTRLSSTWKGLSAEHQRMWAKLAACMASPVDYFDECLLAPNPKILPVIPSLHLLGAQQKHSSSHKKFENMLNFSKYRGISQIVKPIIEAQRVGYAFEPCPNVQLFFDQHLYTLSYQTLCLMSSEIESGSNSTFTNNKLFVRGETGAADQKEDGKPKKLLGREATPRIPAKFDSRNRIRTGTSSNSILTSKEKKSPLIAATTSPSEPNEASSDTEVQTSQYGTSSLPNFFADASPIPTPQPPAVSNPPPTSLSPSPIVLSPQVEQADMSREKMLSDLQTEIRAKWSRPLAQCSVGSDLPRFVRKIVVLNELTKEICFHIPESSNAPMDPLNIGKDISLFLRVLGNQLDAKKELKAMEKSLDLYFGKENIDLLKETDRFTKEILGEASRVTHLLKATCSQGIISPAWMKLRMFILQRHGFKDVKKGWNIAIIIGESKITVVHRKRESSNDETTGHAEFEFVWETRIVFSRRMERMEHASFAIVNVNVSPQMASKKLSALKKAIKDWFIPGSDMFPKDAFPIKSGLIPNPIVLGASPRDQNKKDKKKKSLSSVAKVWLGSFSTGSPNKITPYSSESSYNREKSKEKEKSKQSKPGLRQSTKVDFEKPNSEADQIDSPRGSVAKGAKAKLVRRLSDSSSETFEANRRRKTWIADISTKAEPQPGSSSPSQVPSESSIKIRKRFSVELQSGSVLTSKEPSSSSEFNSKKRLSGELKRPHALKRSSTDLSTRSDVNTTEDVALEGAANLVSAISNMSFSNGSSPSHKRKPSKSYIGSKQDENIAGLKRGAGNDDCGASSTDSDWSSSEESWSQLDHPSVILRTDPSMNPYYLHSQTLHSPFSSPLVGSPTSGEHLPNPLAASGIGSTGHSPSQTSILSQEFEKNKEDKIKLKASRKRTSSHGAEGVHPSSRHSIVGNPLTTPTSNSNIVSASPTTHVPWLHSSSGSVPGKRGSWSSSEALTKSSSKEAIGSSRKKKPENQPSSAAPGSGKVSTEKAERRKSRGAADRNVSDKRVSTEKDKRERVTSVEMPSSSLSTPRDHDDESRLSSIGKGE